MELVYLFQELLAILTNPAVVFILIMSTALGVVVGALPGLSATMGIAILTSLTYKLSVEYTFASLMGIYVGAIYGGSISAILLNIPGTASAAATAIEGNLFAKRGQAVTAIKVTRAASIVGTFIGVFVLALIAPGMTNFALKFSSVEYFLLAIFGVLMCGSIVTEDMALKGWIGGLLGLSISFIGYDVIVGVPRFHFGNINLMGGIKLIAAMIGFYAIPEVIKSLTKSGEVLEIKNIEDDVKLKVNEFKIIFKNMSTIIKASVIGVGIGALPGVGEDVAAWVAYDSVKKGSKQKEKYGTGECYEAIIAPEVANNSAIGGAIIPLLTLAVPGSPPAAVLLGAFMIHNVRPGPMIMIDSPSFIFYIAALIFASTICLWLVGIILAKPMSSILKVPSQYLMPIVAVLSIVGAYAITLNKFDVTIVFIFGVFGYILDKMKYSPAPIVLGIILGTMIDENFRRALIVNQGGFMPFITNSWISIVFFTIIVTIVMKQIFPNIVLNPIKWFQTETK